MSKLSKLKFVAKMADVITLSSDEESSTPPKRLKPMYLGSVSITPVKKNLSKEEKVCPEEIVVISDDINTSLLKNIRITTLNKPKKKRKKKISKIEDVVVLSDEDIQENEKKNKSSDQNIVSEESTDEDCEIVSESGPEIPSSNGKNATQSSFLENKADNDDIQEASSNDKKRENNKYVDPVIGNKESNYEDCEIISESGPENPSSKGKNATKISPCEEKADDDLQEAVSSIKEKKNNKSVDHVDVKEESNDEDCEIISEYDSEKSSSKENKVGKNLWCQENKVGINPSITNGIKEYSMKSKSIKNLPCNSLLEKFLQTCENSVQDTRYVEILKKFPILRKLYKKCDSELIQSQSFQRIIEENTRRAEKSATKAVISFREVYQHTKDVVQAASIEVSEEQRLKLKKLEKTIRALLKRIKRLEEMEVDFEDEDDSSFIQLTRYTDRLNKVYHKYCELMKKNPYTGRLTYAKLDFADSDFNEINRAISKKYKNRKFPSYVEMQNFIEKVVEDNNLPLSQAKIKSESIHCFKKLGELMQSRRKKELYESHYMYIRDGDDPADKDTSLSSTLRDSHKESLSKIEKLCQEYVMKEELGKEADVEEEESDKSDYTNSEKEENVASPDEKY